MAWWALYFRRGFKILLMFHINILAVSAVQFKGGQGEVFRPKDFENMFLR